MNAAEIHARLVGRWPQVLEGVGVDASFLRRKKAGPCPGCGGTDRYTFDDRKGRGDFICRQCGAGDGFALVMRALGCDFGTARRRVLEAAGIDVGEARPAPLCAKTASINPEIAKPPRRVNELLKTSCALESLSDAMEYLDRRCLLPLPDRHGLIGHASAEYYEDRRRVGRYSAILAPVRDIDGELVSVHVTYLEQGRKLANREPRKLWSPVTGRIGVAVRLMPAAELLGIAEGVETALSAAAIDGVPVWAALNTSLLARFEPPPGVTALRIYGDRDEAGLLAALKLTERLQGRIRVETRTPAAPAKDWNDVLIAREGV